MTTTPVHSITDEQIAEIEALAKSAHKSTGDLYLYANSMNPSLLFLIITRLREAEKDAARYRWLRDSGNFSPSAFGNGWSLNCGYTRTQPSLLDTAIDTAMQEHTK